nr:TadE/TadG family type IV pilus assembly protein [uncultured Rhodopila sp.]
MKTSLRTDDRRAIAAFEFALVLPILLILLLAGTDLTIWFINKFRLDNTASEVGNIVAGATALPLSAFPASWCSASSTSLNYFAIAYNIAAPLSVCGTNGATIISGITNNGTSTSMVWQERTGNAAAYPSLIGTPGNALTFPPGYSVPSGHSIIATEVYTGITPWKFSLSFMSGPGAPSLYAHSIFEPRSGTLATPQ